MPKFLYVVILAFAAGTASPLSARAQQAIAAEGRSFALQVCTPCHLVAEDQAGADYTFAPPFKEIANAPGMTERALLVLLYSPHKSMPNLILTPKEAELVVDYILSLRAPR